MQDPAAFFSYAHADDEADGALRRLHAALADEVSAQLGAGFPLFIDRDIAWGDNWRQRIDDSLDNSTLLIPVITPRFFASAECRRELSRFFDRERMLERGFLVCPILYIDAPPLTAPDGDELAVTLATRQYDDWRALRLAPPDAPAVRERLATLAGRIVELVQRAVEPRVLPVDPFGGGPYPTIDAAIAAAEPGSRVVLGPGVYEQSIVIDKPIELLGTGAADVLVAAWGARVLSFRAASGLIRNLTLRQTGGGDFHCVDISQGRLEIEDCHIEGLGAPCVYIHEGADPVLRRNQIRGGMRAGVSIARQARGTLEDNDIGHHRWAAVQIAKGADPVLRRNRIHRSGCGVLLYEDARGLLEDNDICDNERDGIEATEGARPLVRHNRILRNGRFGVFVKDGGGGTFERNQLTDNAGGAWGIYDGDVVRRDNTPD
jgi:nitrous oxidase accessory protein NosD